MEEQSSQLSKNRTFPLTPLRAFVFVLLLGLMGNEGKAVELVKQGKAVCELVVDAQTPNSQIDFAANELQLWVGKMSGAELPIVKTLDSTHTQIILGTPDTSPSVNAIVKKYAADLAKMKKNDGFAIRTQGNAVYVFSLIPKGVMNGVFHFLKINSDLIFVKPQDAENGAGTIYSKNPDFAASKTDCVVIPVFPHIRSVGKGNMLWQARLGNRQVVYDGARARKESQHLGLTWSTHKPTIRQTQIGDTHPEFFAVRGGKPQKGWYTQLCFSNEKLLDFYAKRVANVFASTPDDVKDICVNHSDNSRVCECANCLKPIKLPDGTLLKPSDPSFRSTQFFSFYNRVIKKQKLDEKYPDRYLKAFAYLWSAAPCKIPLSKNLMALFAPYVKSHKVPIYHKNNQPWGDYAKGWMKRHKSIYVYEYYLCSTTPNFYNPVADIAALDLRFYAKSGSVLGMYQDSSQGKAAMDVSAIEYWVISRLYWDPKQDVEELRDEFCRRAYRKAAKPMREYYQKIQEVWHKDPIACSWNDNPVMSARRYIVSANLQEPCRSLLEQAEKLAEHPGSKELIKRHRARFEDWLTWEAKATKKVELRVPYRQDISMDNFDFDSGVWKDAALIDDFRIRRSLDKKSKLPTVVKIVNDRDNIYFAIHAMKEDRELLKKLKGMKKVTDWPQTPFIELFIDGDQRSKSGYYQLAFNALGSQWDAKGRDAKYSNPEWKVNGQIGEDSWKIIMKWPLQSFGRNISMNNRFGMMIYRDTGNQTWLGINVHEPAGFNDLILQMN